MRKIYVFGNEYIEGDEVAKELSKQIQSDVFEFILAESPNEILNIEEELILLDVVKGITEVKIINKIDDLVLANSLSCHDLDLGFYLKLMQQIGKINKIKIIAIPYGNNDYDSLKFAVENQLSFI